MRRILPCADLFAEPFFQCLEKITRFFPNIGKRIRLRRGLRRDKLENGGVFGLYLEAAFAARAFGFHPLDAALCLKRCKHALHGGNVRAEMLRELRERHWAVFRQQFYDFSQHNHFGLRRLACALFPEARLGTQVIAKQASRLKAAASRRTP
jgi:hypothetical protein